MTNLPRFFLALAYLSAVASASAGDKQPPMSTAPAPKPVREMTTDRPDQTEGAFTVPKGWWQFETGLASYTRQLDTDNRVDGWVLGEINAKYGLTDSVDLQLLWQAYANEKDHGDPGSFSEGTTDLYVRLKWNLVGNDGGPFALALIPNVKVPTATHDMGNGIWEGGLAIATEIDLGGGFTLGNTLSFNVNADANEDMYVRPVATAVLGYGITEKLSTYVEVFSTWARDTDRYWQVSFDAGFGYAITDNVIADIGVNWFVEGGEALNPFVGLSWRF